MQSGYTCLRCLSGLRSVSSSSIRLQRSSPTLKRRWISSSLPRSPESSSREPNAFQKRASSSLGSQSQHVKNEPPESLIPGGRASTPPPKAPERVLLQPNNLFHSFSKSPSPEIRRRAAYIKQHAYCPHPNHQRTRIPTSHDLEARKTSGETGLAPAHVQYECPDCGIPVYCSEEHWADDYESHLEICDTLREINEDDHDLRSGRFFPEFEYPGPQIEEALVNMTNWDTFLYTRDFTAINDPRSLRQATRLLTYPVTIGSVLNELSPYNIRRGGRLTTEGLKSLSGRLFFLVRDTLN